MAVFFPPGLMLLIIGVVGLTAVFRHLFESPVD